MKNILGKPFLLAAVIAVPLFSHGMWLEKTKGGYQAFYGEAEDGVRESKDKLMEQGPLVAIAAGKDTVRSELKDDHFFVPVKKAEGMTAILLEAPVYGEGKDAGRPFFHARHVGPSGKLSAPGDTLLLDIHPTGKDGANWQVLKEGQPFGGAWIEVVAPNSWRRWFEADSLGKVRIEAPWKGRYLLRTDYSKDAAGELKGKKYAKEYHGLAVTFEKP